MGLGRLAVVTSPCHGRRSNSKPSQGRRQEATSPWVAPWKTLHTCVPTGRAGTRPWPRLGRNLARDDRRVFIWPSAWLRRRAVWAAVGIGGLAAVGWLDGWTDGAAGEEVGCSAGTGWLVLCIVGVRRRRRCEGGTPRGGTGGPSDSRPSDQARQGCLCVYGVLPIESVCIVHA